MAGPKLCLLILVVFPALSAALKCRLVGCRACKSKSFFTTCKYYCVTSCPVSFLYDVKEDVSTTTLKPPPTTTLLRAKPKKKTPKPKPKRCPNKYEPCISQSEADRRVRQCCHAVGMPEQCKKFCAMKMSYKIGERMFWTAGCSGEPTYLLSMCLMSNADHRKCCASAGVPSACLKNCNGLDPSLKHSDLSVVDRCKPIDYNLAKMVKCFHAYMEP